MAKFPTEAPIADVIKSLERLGFRLKIFVLLQDYEMSLIFDCYPEMSAVMM